jgi:hypothetical protein
MADIDTTRFPFINLAKAVERARALYTADPAGRPMRVANAFELWGYSLKSSGGFQTISALKQYDLIDDLGANEDRKIQITPEARRYFMDEREEEQRKLLHKFALAPKLVGAIWKEWGAAPPADNIARTQLKLDWKLQEQSARSLLSIYKENLDFAGIWGQGDVPAEAEASPAPLSFAESMMPTPPSQPVVHREVQVSANERVVFSEEAGQSQYLKLIASGDMDDALLEALESYVQRQRARLKPKAAQPNVAGDNDEDPPTPRRSS